MNKYKFRAWDSKWGKMYYSDTGDILLSYGSWEIERMFDTGDAETAIIDNKEIFLMQCTGLKSKSGKLIFEGDIVTNGYDFVIKFGIYKDCDHNWQNGFYLNYIGACEDNYPLVNDDICFKGKPDTILKEFEIIGNIYQNSELLEEVK